MTRKYTKIADGKRQELIRKISTGLSIKDASIETNIPYENAKAIFRVFKSELRTD